MSAKKTDLPTIHQRETIDGYVHAYDRDGRFCLDTTSSERVVLVKDLRIYGQGLHIGQLGWTIPETTDGYNVVDVWFDTGQRLRVSAYAFQRVGTGAEKQISRELMTKYRNTRFDSDPDIACQQREEWIASSYGKYMSLKGTTRLGIGDQELYAFTFPSLKELAALKGQEHYSVKVGYAKSASDSACARIRQQMLELAGFPEPPEVLLLWRTWDGRKLENQVHRILRKLDRKAPNSLGTEWFLTSHAELLDILSQCSIPELPVDRVIAGANETLEEGLIDLMGTDGTLEFGIVQGSALISIGVRHPRAEPEQGDAHGAGDIADADDEFSSAAQ